MPAFVSKQYDRFRGVLKKISPPLPVGGLSVSDSGIHFVRFKNGGVASDIFLRFPPGVISSGKIANEDYFVAALMELHRQILPNPKSGMSIILSLPVNDVYVQIFNLPPVAEVNIDEAADLNLRVISPTNIDQVYYSWQRPLDNVPSNGKIELLGAFVARDIIDSYERALGKSGFSISAVEFASLSIARDAAKRNITKNGIPYLLVRIAGDGIGLYIIKNGSPHFHYFHPWKELQGEGISVSVQDMQSYLKSEISRVLNFYSTHRQGERIQNVIVITSALFDEVGAVLTDIGGVEFSLFDPRAISAASGAALRGLVSRAADTEISLASVGSIELFKQHEVFNFIRIWRNVLSTTMSFMLLIFVITDVFVSRVYENTVNSAPIAVSKSDIEDLERLRASAGEFNRLVSSIAGLKDLSKNVYPLVEKIFQTAGGNVEILRIQFSSVGSPVIVHGKADSESSALAFGAALGKIPQFSNVALPISNISKIGDGVTFTLQFMTQTTEL